MIHTLQSKWYESSNKLTKLEIFSSVLDVEKMIEYTKGEGCVDDGDYLSWDSMQWNLHGAARIEHKEAEEICRLQRFSFYAAGFEWQSCMHFCENLGGSRVPPVTTLHQWKSVSSFLARRQISDWQWLPVVDEQN